VTKPIFCGNITDEFNMVGNVTDGTQSDGYDPTFSQSAIGFNTTSTTTGFIGQSGLGDLTAGWFHFGMGGSAGTWANNVPFAILYDNAGNQLIRVLTLNAFYVVQWNNAGTWTTIGNSTAVVGNSGVFYRFDVNVVLNGASSSAQLYVNGVLANGAGTFTAPAGWAVDRFILWSPQGDNHGACSEVIVHTSPTINLRYATTMPASLGTHQDWIGSGTIGNVAKIAVNDGTSIQSGTVGDVTTYVGTAIAAVAAAQTVSGIKIITRGRHDGSGPQDVDGVLRLGGTDYFTADTALDFGFAGHALWFETDPSTGVAFTPAVAGSALEFGVRSAVAA